jgi:acyl dehydratase
MRTINGMDELVATEGDRLGVSEWHEVTQESVNAFAETTGDTYWIHTDPQRAKHGPLGSTIAHGLYTLSLGPMFTDSLVTFEGFTIRLNYGYEKVRFPAPLPVGARVRMHLEMLQVKPVAGAAQATLRNTFEREGTEKPVCVADHVIRFVA